MQNKRERERSFTSWFICQMHTEQEMGQVKARSQGIHPGLLHEWQGLNNGLSCLPECITSSPDRMQHSWSLHLHSDMGCRHVKRCLCNCSKMQPPTGNV